jgi:hypothetical protein
MFEKVILTLVQEYIEERSLLNTSQFRFGARHSTAWQYMRFTDQSTAVVFLDIEKGFDTHGTLVCCIN